MEKQILKLRQQGKSYGEIQKILKCSKSTISYYCGENQKDKSIERMRKRRKNVLFKKIENFKYDKNLKESIRKFQKTDISNGKRKINAQLNLAYSVDDVLNKFGNNPRCYISGESIDLKKNTYSLDHMIPVSKGGKNDLSNMGLTTQIVNRMKSDMTKDELIEMCKKILIHNGYDVN